VSFNLQLKRNATAGPYTVTSDSKGLTRKDVDRLFRWNMIFLLLGLLGLLIACVAYRLLDAGPIYFTGLAVFGLPMGFYFVSLIRKREVQQVQALKQSFRWSAALLIVLVCLLFANGALDHSAANQVQSTVLRKYKTTGRRSVTYHLAVRSWRDRPSEDLQVGSKIFQRIAEGQRISVELHPGYFGIAWYGRVVPL
jgi:hypothetical protein